MVGQTKLFAWCKSDLFNAMILSAGNESFRWGNQFLIFQRVKNLDFFPICHSINVSGLSSVINQKSRPKLEHSKKNTMRLCSKQYWLFATWLDGFHCYCQRQKKVFSSHLPTEKQFPENKRGTNKSKQQC